MSIQSCAKPNPPVITAVTPVAINAVVHANCPWDEAEAGFAIQFS
jgi:hypothetical protein